MIEIGAIECMNKGIKTGESRTQGWKKNLQHEREWAYGKLVRRRTWPMCSKCISLLRIPSGH